MEKIFALASQFRKAIESATEDYCFESDISFRYFSRGCCGDATDLLIHFLLQQNIKSYYICGTYYGNDDGFGQSHAWAQLSNRMIVDITGDQFKNKSVFLNYSTPVYIGRGDDFHKLFKVEERDVRKGVTLENLGNDCYARLRWLYDTILAHM